jgi:hypothetical protein
MQSLNIALDFDGTFDRDPHLWGGLIENARYGGHQVFIVTCREGTPEDRETIAELLGRGGVDKATVLFTNRRSKVDYMKNVAKIRIDIWIDDDPETLVRGH